MRYLRVDTRQWLSPRLLRLVEELGISRMEGIGTLAFFWHTTRQAGLEEATAAALAEMFALHFAAPHKAIAALEAAGYLAPTSGGALQIVDNVGAAAAKERRVAAAKAGVAARAKKLKPKATPKPRKPKDKLAPSINTPVWEAYAEAYEQRWSHPPARNARASSIIKKIVERIGAEAATQLVRFYVAHNDGFYLKKTHDIQYCLSDCDPLYTQMRRGEQITRTGVDQAEKHNHYVAMMEQIQTGQI